MPPEISNNLKNIDTPQPEIKGQAIKIEARPVKEIFEELDDSVPDFGEDEPSAADYSRAFLPGATVDLLPYIPFDPLKALDELKKSPRAERPAKLKEIKDHLREQTLGIAAIIRDLRKTINDNPDVTAIELYNQTRAAASQYQLSGGQRNIFKFLLEDYEKQHGAVKKYRDLYPKDEDLFAACFGRQPKEEIKVITSPLTIHFVCFSLDDYAAAYNVGGGREDTNEVTADDKARADLSGGAALWASKIEELKGAITIENAHYNVKYEVVKQDKIADIHQSGLKLLLDNQGGDIDIEVKGQGKWQIKIVERDDLQFPTRLQVFNGNYSAAVPTLDLARSSVEQNGWQYYGFKNKKNEADKYLHVNVTEPLEIGADEARLHLGEINLDYDLVEIIDNSSAGSLVRYQENTVLPAINNPEYSKTTQVHEEQHQFNKLFVPQELRLGFGNIIASVAEKAQSPEEAKKMVVHDLLRAERRNLMDKRARDEIISHYHDGKTSADVYAVMKTPLYDYFKHSKEEIEKIPQEIVHYLVEEVSEVTYQKEPDEKGQAGYIIDVVPLKVDEDIVKKQIEPIFKDDYQRDLARWTGVLELLEKKGYNRDEIVSVLVQEPIKNWPAVARRLGEKGN